MAEMRMTSVIGLVVVVGAVGLVGAAAMGFVAIGPLNKDAIWGLFDKGASHVTGFTPAKTPQEAMDKFREAVEARKYKTAATYCTKSYADMLERAAVGAADLGAAIDAIQDYSKNKQLFTDKTTFLFFKLDAFPRVLKSGSAPTIKGDKAYGAYKWEEPKVTTPIPKLAMEVASMDPRMFQNVLVPQLIFGREIEIVKEGDAWKLNIPTNPGWEGELGYFTDHWKTYHTGLESFEGSMTNHRFASPAAFEQEVIEKLRAAKKT